MSYPSAEELIAEFRKDRKLPPYFVALYECLILASLSETLDEDIIERAKQAIPLTKGIRITPANEADADDAVENDILVFASRSILVLSGVIPHSPQHKLHSEVLVRDDPSGKSKFAHGLALLDAHRQHWTDYTNSMRALRISMGESMHDAVRELNLMKPAPPTGHGNPENGYDNGYEPNLYGGDEPLHSSYLGTGRARIGFPAIGNPENEYSKNDVKGKSPSHQQPGLSAPRTDRSGYVLGKRSLNYKYPRSVFDGGQSEHAQDTDKRAGKDQDGEIIIQHHRSNESFENQVANLDKEYPTLSDGAREKELKRLKHNRDSREYIRRHRERIKREKENNSSGTHGGGRNRHDHKKTGYPGRIIITAADMDDEHV